jgi:hypothetical protein
MTEQITRDEFLAHIGYVRADVAEVKAAVGAVGERTNATELEIALLKAAAAAAETGRARRRTSADAFVVAILGVGGAAVIEWIKAHLFGATR